MENKIYNLYDIETIGALAEIVKKNELSELTLVDGGKSITLKGKKQTPPLHMPMPPMGMQPMVNVTAAAAAETSSTQEKTPELSGNVVKSPIVGTFYAAPSPDKAPFVKIGDTVKKGDVIMIIESMKLMNEIQSDFDGVVSEILVNNGDAVEFDQPIMIIK